MTNAAFWDELTDEYAAKPVELPGAFEREIEITQSLMLPTNEVLDVGSLALRLAPSGDHIHALDLPWGVLDSVHAHPSRPALDRESADGEGNG